MGRDGIRCANCSALNHYPIPVGAGCRLCGASLVSGEAAIAVEEFDDEPRTNVDAFADIAMEDLIRASAWLPTENA